MTKSQKKILYLVTDSNLCKFHSLEKVVEDSLLGGVQIVQYREKQFDPAIHLDLVIRLRKICSDHSALFIVNDSVELAIAVGADGVHLGQKDMAIEDARKILGSDKIIGLSIETEDDLVAILEKDQQFQNKMDQLQPNRLQFAKEKNDLSKNSTKDEQSKITNINTLTSISKKEDLSKIINKNTLTTDSKKEDLSNITNINLISGMRSKPKDFFDSSRLVQYLGVSPIFPTPTKLDTKGSWGISGIQKIRSLTDIPLVAIGGINLENADSILQAGADSIAIVSAICSSPDPQIVAKQLKTIISKYE